LSDVISDFIFEIVAINITSNSAIIYIITLFVNYMHISTLLSNRAKKKDFAKIVGIPYQTIVNWKSKGETPKWVDTWLENYEYKKFYDEFFKYKELYDYVKIFFERR
ncbi:hypothetical protein, partial [Campylobacter jejuni]